LNTVSWYSASLELREHGDTTVPFTILSVESLAGKVVLVTGGARKLGRAMVSAAAHAGAKVALTYLGSKSSSEKLIEELAQANREGLAVECDVRDPRSVAAAVTKVIWQFGAIDVLINNAAVFETRAFDRITAEEWDRVFATNVRGPFLVSQECLPVLRKSRGRIIVRTIVENGGDGVPVLSAILPLINASVSHDATRMFQAAEPVHRIDLMAHPLAGKAR